MTALWRSHQSIFAAPLSSQLIYVSARKSPLTGLVVCLPGLNETEFVSVTMIFTWLAWLPQYSWMRARSVETMGAIWLGLASRPASDSCPGSCGYQCTSTKSSAWQAIERTLRFQSGLSPSGHLFLDTHWVYEIGHGRKDLAFWRVEKERLKTEFEQEEIWMMQYQGRRI